MRAVSFFKTVVTTAGTPVSLGASTTNGALAQGATSLTITSAIPFSPDMLPFILTLDTLENIIVSYLAGRGSNGVKATA